MSTPLTLMIISADGGSRRIECDSVTLYSMDDARGNNGGSIGIRKGHMPAVVALEPGSRITAKIDGSAVYSCSVVSGFASVRDNVVTVAGLVAE